jgi:hypothetical protein
MQRHRTGVADHAAQPCWLSAALVKVGGDPTAQIQGFSTIEDSASAIAKEIDSWLLGELGEIRPPAVIHGVRSVPWPSRLGAMGATAPKKRLQVVAAISVDYNGISDTHSTLERSVEYSISMEDLAAVKDSVDALVMTRCAAR